MTSPSKHPDIIILRRNSLEQKQSEDLARGGFLPWRIDL